MQYDLFTNAGIIGVVGILVQFIKTHTSLAKHVPVWLVVVLVSGALVGLCQWAGMLSGGWKSAAVQVLFNALASSGAFTWVTGQAAKKPEVAGPHHRKKHAE